jgi:hypothetical protein
MAWMHLFRGDYIIRHGNLNEIYFSNGCADFCDMNQLIIGSLIAVREERIGLFVVKIR